MQRMGEGGDVKQGDTIRCADKDDAVEYLTALMQGGQDADFLYEKDGEKGLWVVVGGPLEEEET